MKPVSRLSALLPALFLLVIMTVGSVAWAAEPTLELDVGATPRYLTRSELLANPAVRTISITDDAAYHHPMHYQALPWSALFKPEQNTTNAQTSVQFTATDGFVANIPLALLSSAGQAWLAIEPDGAAWPALKPGGPSAGPFYLVWLRPEKSGVSQEQWPYQIAKIAVMLPLESRYPQILPHASASDAAQRGLHVYTANCASCHPINGKGDAAVGPDLNIPANPTEYFQETYLRKLIRDPASVRNWSQRIMPGFSTNVLSDAQIDDLFAYLRQMATQRP